MGEFEFDKKFGIRTSGIKEWGDDFYHYHRCEPTPYKALEKLFNNYNPEKSGRLVDFGSGKGRVAFYIHNRFQIPVVGIEAQDDVIDEALDNKKRYRLRAKNIEAPIRFEYGLAEDYEVKPQDNIFFFFNPFSADVFRDVLKNIRVSLKESPREADLILYYPMPKYKKIMENAQEFEIHNKVAIQGARDNRDKFIVYRHRPDEE